MVFCDDGVSRSPAIAVAYLMYAKRQSYASANAFVKLKKNTAKINFGFVK